MSTGTIIILLIVAVIAWLYSRSILHPAVVTCVLWASMLILYSIFGQGLNPLSNRFYSTVLLWSLTLSGMSILASRKHPIGYTNLDDSPNAKSVNILIPIVTVCLVIGILATIARGMIYDSSNIFHGIREASVADMYGKGELANHNALISLILAICAAMAMPLCMAVCFYKGDRHKLTIVLCLLAFIFIFIRSNKYAIAQAGLAVLCLIWFQDKVKKRYIFGLAAVLLVLLLISHMIRRVDSVESFSVSGFIVSYFLSPLPAFDYLLNMGGDFVETFHGEFTFRSLTRITQLIDPTLVGNSDPHCLHRWVAVPRYINVYTCMMPFYEDFRLVGIGVFGCLYGLVSGHLFRGMQQGIAASTLLYCNMFYILVFQFFADFGIMFLGTLILLVAGVLCICYKPKPCPHK